MPIYEYECCGMKWEIFHNVADRGEEFCPVCDEKAERLISETARPVIQEYFSENLGAQVTGPKQKQQLMKSKGLEAVG